MGARYIDGLGGNDNVNGISAYNGDIYVAAQVFSSGFSVETASGTVTRTNNAAGKSAGLLVKYTRPLNEFTLPSSVYLPRTVTFAAPTTYAGYTGTFAYSSSNTSVATISGNAITFVGAGSTVISAVFTTSGGQSFKIFASMVGIIRNIDINIPLEIDAGSFATAVTVQGETVAYNHFNLPLQYETQGGDVTLQEVAQVFQFKEAADQTEVAVDVYQNTIGSFENGQAVIKALFKSALEANVLYNIPMAEGPVYADDSARDTTEDPVKFYVDKDTHNAGTSLGSSLKTYLQEYLYDNLSKIIGLAATSGAIDITMSRSGVDASEIIADALASQLCGSSNTEQGVAAAALRQNVYEQIFSLAPERFQDSSLMRRTTADDAEYKNLPLVAGDSLAFLVTFKFPASQISAPVIRNAIRTGSSSTYVDTGNKIQVMTSSDATGQTRPNLSDFPSCTVLMRTKLAATGVVPVAVYTRLGSSPASIPASPASLTSGVIVDNVLTHSYEVSRNWTGNFGESDVYFKTKAFAHANIGSSSKVIVRMGGTDYDIDVVERGFWTTGLAVPDPRFYFYDLVERDAATNPTGVTVPSYEKAGVNGGDGLYQFVIMEMYEDDTYATVSGHRVAIMKINTYGVIGSAFSGWGTRLQMDPTADPYVFERTNVSVAPGQFMLTANTKANFNNNPDIYNGLIAALDLYTDTTVGQISLVNDNFATADYLSFSGATGTYNIRVNIRDPAKPSFELTPV
jgi:hypothetical protein